MAKNKKPYRGAFVCAHGPVECRIKWVPDDYPHDFGVFETPEEIAEIRRCLELYGVYGCVIETRAPACPCCGRSAWEHAESLWSIVGDLNYHHEIERELIAEVAAA